jgi:hypothetical protein
MLPDNELAAFLITAQDAVDLAHYGDAADGYEMLLGGLHRARGVGGKPWSEELVTRCSLALERFAEMYAKGGRES